MHVQVLKSKIHRATVTQAALHYQGSLTLGGPLMDAAHLLPHEFVHITNINTGAHWVTYAIRDEEAAETVCMNGTAARHFEPGDPVIILAYAYGDEAEASVYRPFLVYVDGQNHVTEIRRG